MRKYIGKIYANGSVYTVRVIAKNFTQADNAVAKTAYELTGYGTKGHLQGWSTHHDKEGGKM